MLAAHLLLLGITLQDPPKDAPAAPPARLKTISAEDTKKWERLGRTEITADGRWFAAQIALVDGDGYVLLRSVDGPERARVDRAGQFGFSDDSQWFAAITLPPKAEVDKLRAENKPVPQELEFRRLADGQPRKIANVARFQFLKGGKTLLVLKRPEKPGPDAVGDLQLIDLATGEPTVVQNAERFSLNEAQDLVAVAVQSSTGDKGLQLVDLKSGRTRNLAWGKPEAATMDWAEDKDVLVVAFAEEEEKKEGARHVLAVFPDPRASNASVNLDPGKLEQVPKDWRIAESGGLSLSRDGRAVFFGVQPWKDKRPPRTPQQERERAGVEVWNTRDIRPMPLQRNRSGQDRGATLDWAWFPEGNRLVKLNEDLAQTPILSGSSEFVAIRDDRRYDTAKTDGVSYEDIEVVNLADGSRWKALEKARSPYFNIGDTGRFGAYYADKHWWTVDFQSKARVKLEAKGVDFENPLDDGPATVKAPAGFPVWFRGDKGLLVSDLYDTWLATPGQAGLVRLTDGRKEQIQSRFVSVVDTRGKAPELSDSLYFSTRELVTKGTGFFLSDGKGGGRALTRELGVLSRLTRAKEADRMLFVLDGWKSSPDAYVTNGAFSQAKPMTRTNPKQKEFAWGDVSLIQYKSRWGVPLEGALITPANYVKGRSYPMVVYIYERVSDEGFGYATPDDRDPYNAQWFSQNGYFVLFADIAYRKNSPGIDAVDCLEPALDAARRANSDINAAKIGLMGHSWGGYQTAFVTTVSKRFAVGVAGAPLTELTSMYNSFYWNSGSPNQVIFEQSQGRFTAPFWENPEAYLRNSPVWRSAERTSPLLVLFGDQDGAVDWHQGQYLFNTLRRMGKEMAMVVYAGENHFPTREPNQRDFARRLRHYMDVHLKGAKPEPWVNQGVPYLEQSDR